MVSWGASRRATSVSRRKSCENPTLIIAIYGTPCRRRNDRRRGARGRDANLVSYDLS
jgi:hypothetical protein